MEEYLRVCNEKVGVYRDIIIEGDYDPLKERKRTITYDESKIRDPCKQDLFKVLPILISLDLISAWPCTTYLLPHSMPCS